jgi:Ca2+-binding RTX toxin-like protein
MAIVYQGVQIFLDNDLGGWTDSNIGLELTSLSNGQILAQSLGSTAASGTPQGYVVNSIDGAFNQNGTLQSPINIPSLFSGPPFIRAGTVELNNQNRYVHAYVDPTANQLHLTLADLQTHAVIGTNPVNLPAFQFDMGIGALTNGNFVVAGHVGDFINGAWQVGTYFYLYNASGQLLVNSLADTQAHAFIDHPVKVAGLADGGFVVAHEISVGTVNGIRYSVMNANGTIRKQPEGVDFLPLPPGGVLNSELAEVVATPDGGFGIIYSSTIDGEMDLRYHKYDANGIRQFGYALVASPTEIESASFAQIMPGTDYALIGWKENDFTTRESFVTVLNLLDGTIESETQAGVRNTRIDHIAGPEFIHGAAILGQSQKFVIGTGLATGSDPSNPVDARVKVYNFERQTLTNDDSTFVTNPLDSMRNSVQSGAGNDTISTGFGDDNIGSGAGNDVITTLDGKDAIYAGAGDDTVFAGGGNDILGVDAGADWLDGGAGVDTLDFGLFHSSAVFVQLGGQQQYAQSYTGPDGALEQDTLISIENVIAGSSDDYLYGSSDANDLRGGGGNDYIEAGDGDDVVLGGIGRDMILGGYGRDSIEGGNETGAGDTIYGGAQNDAIFGNDGNDYLYGEHGTDTLFGGNGTDVLFVDAADIAAGHVDGGAGVDYIVWHDVTTAANIDLSAHSADYFYGYNGDDIAFSLNTTVRTELHGGNGNDTLVGSAGVGSILLGEGDNDRLVSETGIDHMLGGTGADTFAFFANGGIDYIYDFERGTDRIDVTGLVASGIHAITDFVINSNYAASGWYGYSYGTGTIWANTGVAGSLTAPEFLFG